MRRTVTAATVTLRTTTVKLQEVMNHMTSVDINTGTDVMTMFTHAHGNTTEGFGSAPT